MKSSLNGIGGNMTMSTSGLIGANQSSGNLGGIN